MQIYGPYRVSTAPNTAGTSASKPAGESAATSTPGRTRAADELDLSSARGAEVTRGAEATRGVEATGGVNRLAATEATAGGDIRIDRVAQIRREIADGSYDTDAKMDAALGKLLDTFG